MGDRVQKRLRILHKNPAFPELIAAEYGELCIETQTVTKQTLPLGENSDYPSHYEPAVLFAIPRDEARAALGLQKLPFRGTDIWNAWELTWLGPAGLPVVATAEIRVPADSPKLIESKSLKLYLGSFAMSHFDGPGQVAASISADLSTILGVAVQVDIERPGDTALQSVAQLPGTCIDTLAVSCSDWEVDASLLRRSGDNYVEEQLHTHLLRSLCPVTSQPDTGSLAIHYHGPGIEPESLLKYVVSFRQHNDFHEACIERIFVDIMQHCNTERLSVYGRYQRRGGIDINPFRSNFEDQPANPRLWRQ